MELTFPTIAHKEDAWAYRQEHFDHGDTTIHGDGGLDHAESYEAWLIRLQSELIRDDDEWVPNATYFGIVDGRIVGTVNIRYKLTENMRLFTGHIGYGVRPTERCKGYATQMLALALEKCRELGLEQVLITCNKDNLPSAKTAIKNGGVYEGEDAEEDGTLVQRYWIAL